MTLAVTGATGQLGRLVIQRLTKKNTKNLVALVRSPQKAHDLGVPARQADYDRPETLEAALNGVETLLLISSSEVGKRATQHQNALDAARRAGVKRIVYTSLLHADTSGLSIAAEHHQTESALRASGIPHTILRNGWYIENHTATIRGALASGAVIGSAGAGRFSSATRADFADAAVAVLTSAGHEGKLYELAGDAAFTLADFAAELSRQSGKSIPYKNLAVDEYVAALAGLGLPAEIAQAVASWDVAASRGDLYEGDNALSQLIGRPTTPLANVIAETLRAL